MRDEPNVHPLIAGKGSVRRLGALIAPLAARQHGVVERKQLYGLGLSRHQIDGLIAAGHLHPLFRGVYAVGHRAVTREGRYTAAVLAAGPGFVISHAAAAELHGLMTHRGDDVDVTGPRQIRRQRGLCSHDRRLEGRERTTRHGIPVTTAARTIRDLAERLNPAQLEHLIRKAEYTDKGTIVTLAEALKRHPNRRGNAALHKALEHAQAGQGITRKQLERRFKSMLRRHRLPPPDFNQPVHLAHGTYEVDCLWRRQRLIVELDGRAAHATAAAFEDDRARDAHLTAAGYRVIRITWRRLREGEGGIAMQLATLLSP